MMVSGGNGGLVVAGVSLRIVVRGGVGLDWFSW